MLARCLGILVVSCALGSQLACGSATADDADTGADDGTNDVPDVRDESPSDVPDEGEDVGGCEAGFTDCDGVCVDLETDPEHCGACENSCPDALHATGTCASESCGLRCDPGWVDVDPDPGCDLECTPSTPAVEDCDGVDDDCNGLTDDGAGFECVFGTTESCTTTCGTPGTNTCTGECIWDCVPPDEVCDGVDQDCDGVVDDGLYGVVWAVEALPAVTGTAVFSVALAVANDEVGLGYVLSTGAATTVGQPRFVRSRLSDGSQPGAAVALGSGSSTTALAAGASASIASFVWSTSDGATPRGESLQVRSALLGSAYVLGASGVVDSSDEAPSADPSVARSLSDDVAYVAWIEVVSAVRRVEVASVENRVSPAVAATVVVSADGNPADPSIAIHGDDTILVAWAAGLPADIQVQRLSADLELLGIAQNLSNTDAAESTRPGVAAADDGFLVVWEETGVGVMLSTLGADGSVGTAATTLAAGGATGPVVAPDLGGGFAVAYETDSSVELVRVNADGIPHGDPLVFDGASHPALAAIPDGGLILAFLQEGSVRLVRIGCPP
jgi:hypothetical protein